MGQAHKHAIVVGAGIGGLSTAARLAHQGWQVTLLEAQDQLGGRIGELRRDDYRFDTGPTLLMMLEPLERLFSDLHRRLEDYLDLILLEPSYRVFFTDGTVFDSSTNIARMVREIEKIAPQEVAGYLRLMADLRAMYQAVIPAFVRREYRRLGDLLSPAQIGLLFRFRLLDNLWRRVGRYVRDPRLRTLFSFQTMYLGISPMQARWVYAILTYMESGEGIWYPRSGMYQLIRALRAIAEEEGVTIVTNTPVAKVLTEGNRAVGVQLLTGEKLLADCVVLNVDAPTAYSQMLPPSRFAHRRWRASCSAMMFYIGYRQRLPHLLHHNVFFAENVERNFDEIFRLGVVPCDPSFYACLSNRTDPTDSPPDGENLYILIPVPNLSGVDASASENQLLEHVIARLNLDDRQIEFVEKRTPHDWVSLGLWQGAAFGISPTFFQSTYFRPSIRSPFENLYLVGASTHPGNGIPMVLIASELVAAAVQDATRACQR
ncbi:MAG: phytoene desaturase family protein [Armatimonadota bacterium]